MEYLSPEWLAAAGALVAADPGLAEVAKDLDLAVEYVVADGPAGDVTYHLRLAGGSAALDPGPATNVDVRFGCDHATALAVATGTLGAQRAFMEGRLRVGGDVRAIVAAQGVLATLGDVLAPIRPPAPRAGGDA